MRRAEVEGRVDQLIVERFGVDMAAWIDDLCASLRGSAGELPIEAAGLAPKVGASVTNRGCPTTAGSTYAGDEGFTIEVLDTLNNAEANFTIAHEIGHVMLFRASNGTLTDGDDVEAFCDEFAIRLLVPPGPLMSALKTSGLTITTLKDLASLCQVPWRTLVPRIVALVPAALFAETLDDEILSCYPNDRARARHVVALAESHPDDEPTVANLGWSGIDEWAIEQAADPVSGSICTLATATQVRASQWTTTSVPAPLRPSKRTIEAGALAGERWTTSTFRPQVLSQT